MLKNYFKTAIRSLLRNKVYSIINIFGLSLGLACAMLIILYVKDELSFDRFHANSTRLYRIISQETSPDGSTTQKMGITGFLQGPRFTARVPEIEAFVRIRNSYRDIKTGHEVKSQAVVLADSNFFSIFSFPFLSGNPRMALLQPNSVVITETVAKRQFGTTAVIGKILFFRNNDEFTPYTITGVARDCPQNSSVQFEVMLPLRVSHKAEANEEAWFNSFLSTYVLLTPQARAQEVDVKIQRAYKEDAADAIKIMQQKYGQTDRTVYFLQPFTETHLDKTVLQNVQSNASDPIYSYILSGIALFILLIASINFVNLTVARSLKRAKEIGIRKVIGSTRRQLITQFLGESFLLSFVAFVLAILLVNLALPVFNELANKSLAMSYLLDRKLIGSYVALFILTGVLAGFYPALLLSGYDPVQTLYSRFTLGGKNYLQKGLVVIQFALASFLIIGTAILFSQFNFLTAERLGYDDNNLVKVFKQELSVQEAALFRQELLKDPDILGVAPKDDGFSYSGAKINGNSDIGFVYATIDRSFLPLLKIPLVKGRNFSTDYFTDSASSVLVNETFVKKAGWKDPIGQTVVFGGKETCHVVGVIKDYHFEALNTEIKPQLLSMRQDNGFGDLYIRIRPNTETSSLGAIEKTFKRLFPLSPFSLAFQNEINRKNYEAEARWKQILLFGAIITILISCVGLFGLSVLSAERRTKEIGIRKVLGASVGNLVSILSKDFLKLVILSLLIAIPLSWMAAAKWLEHYPYRIRLGWEIFALTGLAVVGIAISTVSFQSIRAALANPVESLRSE